MFRDALRYLRNDPEESLTTVGLGAVLTAFSFLIVPQIVLLGYFVRVLRRTADGDEIPPAFDDWWGLLVDGAKAYVIWLGWTLVPLIVQFGLTGGHLEPGQATLWLSGWMLGATSISVLDLAADAPGFLGWYSSWEPYVILLITFYIFPAALANFAETGRVRSGFFEGGVKRFLDWGIELVGRIVPPLAKLLELLSNRFISSGEFAPVSTLRSRRYLIAWGGYFTLFVLGEVILRFVFYLPDSVPSSVGLLYFIAALPAYFYLRVAGWSIIGRAWSGMSSTVTEPRIQSEADRTRRREDDRYAFGHGRDERTASHRLLADFPLKIALLGGMITVISVLQLPALLVGGYLVRVLRTTMNDERLPAFSGVRELLSDGIRIYAIWFAYILIPATLLSVGPTFDVRLSWLVNGLGLPGGYLASTLSFIGGLIGLILLSPWLILSYMLGLTPDLIPSLPVSVALGAFVIGLYIVPAAILNFAKTGSFRSAFAFRSLVSLLVTRSYATRWLATALLTTAGWAAFFGAGLLMLRLGVSPSAEVVAGLEHVPFFVLPGYELLIVLGTFVGSSTFYFVLLVVSCRILGSVERI